MHEALECLDFTTVGATIGHNYIGPERGYGFLEISELGGAIEKAAKSSGVALLRDRLLRQTLMFSTRWCVIVGRTLAQTRRRAM